jgi:hypothetical protein
MPSEGGCNVLVAVDVPAETRTPFYNTHIGEEAKFARAARELTPRVGFEPTSPEGTQV